MANLTYGVIRGIYDIEIQDSEIVSDGLAFYLPKGVEDCHQQGKATWMRKK